MGSSADTDESLADDSGIGGRAWFGIGAGYRQAEADDLGVALPAIGERFAALEDVLQLALRMWSGDDSALDGHRIHARRPIGFPAPSTTPHPRILIGGAGETRTLRLVARYADACNLPDVGDGGALIRRKLAVLADHCTAEQRPLQDIEKTVSTRLEPGEAAGVFVERAAALAALGLDHLVVLTRSVDPRHARRPGVGGAGDRRAPHGRRPPSEGRFTLTDLATLQDC